MKKTSKTNALKTFNDNNAMAYKKASGAMNAFKKSLKKAPDGGFTAPQPMIGPKTQEQAMMSNIMNYQPPIPFANRESAASMGRKTMMDSMNNKPFNPRGSNGPRGTYEDYKPKPLSDAERRFNEMKLDTVHSQGAKKGGSVKRKK